MQLRAMVIMQVQTNMYFFLNVNYFRPDRTSQKKKDTKCMTTSDKKQQQQK